VGLRTVTINEPADGVVELRSSTHLARIRINTGPVSQRAVLALLRVAEEAALIPLLFSTTGFSNGAVGFSASQNVGLFDLAVDGEIIAVNKAAGQLMPEQALEPAFASPIEATEPESPISYFEVPSIEDEPDVEELAGAEDMSDWLTCPRCGSSHHPGSRMCASCGTDLAARTGGGQLLGPRGAPAVVPKRAPGPSNPPERVGPTLQCRTCGSHEIELIYPD
jgi:ribosomal protein L37E